MKKQKKDCPLLDSPHDAWQTRTADPLLRRQML